MNLFYLICFLFTIKSYNLASFKKSEKFQSNVIDDEKSNTGNSGEIFVDDNVVLYSEGHSFRDPNINAPVNMKMNEKNIVNDGENLRVPKLSEEPAPLPPPPPLDNSIASPIASPTLCKITACHITCSNNEKLNISMNVTNCKVFNVTFLNYHFQDDIVRRTDLDFLKIFEKLRFIEFKNSDIKEINPAAFELPIFQGLHTINLYGNKISSLNASIFSGLTHLRRLKIQQDHTIVDVAHDTFRWFHDTLCSLKISANLRVLQNITNGCVVMSDLTYVDFSGNNFKDSLIVDIFEKLAMVNSLNLSYSQITNLPSGVFDTIATTLQVLDLRGNLITKISNLILAKISNFANRFIYFGENPLECCCETKQFCETLLISKMNFDFANVTCMMNEGYRIPLRQWTFCDNDILPPKSIPETREKRSTKLNEVEEIVHVPTTATNADSSIEESKGKVKDDDSSSIELEEKNLIKLKCKDCDSNGECSKANFNMKLSPADGELIFKALNDTSCEVQFKNPKQDLGLVWFSSTSVNIYEMEVNQVKFGLGCRQNFAESSTLNNLVPDTAYTVCLIQKRKYKQSPFNCYPLYLQSTDSENSEVVWVGDEQKTLFIVLVPFIFALSFMTGAVFLFLIVRCKPTLLKGSKRIVVPLKGSKDVMVIPKRSSLQYDMKKDEKFQDYIVPDLYEIIPGDKKCDKDVAFCNCTYETPILPPKVPKRLSEESSISTISGELSTVLCDSNLSCTSSYA